MKNRRKSIVILFVVIFGIIKFSTISKASSDLEIVTTERKDNTEVGYIKENFEYSEDMIKEFKINSEQLYETTPTLETIKTFYYKQLTHDIAKEIYKGMQTDIEGNKDIIDIIFSKQYSYQMANNSNEEIIDMYQKNIRPYVFAAIIAARNDIPMMYWFDSIAVKYKYKVDEETNKVTFGGVSVKANIDEKNDNENFKNKVKSVVESIKGDSIYEIVKKCNDFICENVQYENRENIEGVEKEVIEQTAYGALMQKKANSKGYAKLFKILCDQKGIICINVDGKVGQDNESHTWNYVYHSDDNKWYAVDTAMNDNNLNVFLVGSSSVIDNENTFSEFYIQGDKRYDDQTYIPVAPDLTSTAYEEFKVDVTYSEKNMTKGPVTVTIKSERDLKPIEGWSIIDRFTLTKQYTENTEETVTVLNRRGEKYIANIKIDNINREETKFTVNYSHKLPTNEDVVVEIVSNQEIKPIEGWELSEDKMRLTKIYAENQQEKVEVESVNGYIETIEIVINQIDKEKPKLLVEYSNTEITNESVEVKIKGNEELQEIEGWKLLQDRKTLTKIYEGNVEEVIEIQDIAGNVEIIEIKIENIDKEEATYEIFYENNESDRTVLVTIKSDKEIKPISGWELSEDKKSITKVYSNNKIEIVTLEAINGMKKELTVQVDSIKEQENDENIGNEDIGNEDIGNEDIGNEDIGNEDIGNEDIGNEDIGNEDIGNEDIGNEDIENEDIDDEEMDDEDIIDEDIDDEDNQFDETMSNNILPKAGFKSYIIISVVTILIAILVIIFYKKYNSYKEIK